MCPNCPEGRLDPECPPSPPLWSWLQFGKQSFSSHLGFHTAVSSLTLNFFHFLPCAHTCHPLPFTFFSLFFVLADLQHRPLSLLYTCAQTGKTLAALECDLGRSGVHLGPLEDLHSSPITLIKKKKKTRFPSRPSEKVPLFVLSLFVFAVQPSLDECVVAVAASFEGNIKVNLCF